MSRGSYGEIWKDGHLGASRDRSRKTGHERHGHDNPIGANASSQGWEAAATIGSPSARRQYSDERPEQRLLAALGLRPARLERS
jgi:hypothetical protein